MNYQMLCVALLGFQAGTLFPWLLLRKLWLRELSDLYYEQACTDDELRQHEAQLHALRKHLGIAEDALDRGAVFDDAEGP